MREIYRKNRFNEDIRGFTIEKFGHLICAIFVDCWKKKRIKYCIRIDIVYIATVRRNLFPSIYSKYLTLYFVMVSCSHDGSQDFDKYSNWKSFNTLALEQSSVSCKRWIRFWKN